MKVILNQLWNEPAAVIGLFVSLGLLVIALLGDTSWDAETIIGLFAPLATGLGIRGLVTPVPKEEK